MPTGVYIRRVPFSKVTLKKMRFAKLGKPLSKEHRQRLSESHLGKHFSKITRRKMSLARMGKHPSEETIEKIRKKNLGMVSWIKGGHLSDEHKRRISKSHIGNRHSEETKKKIAKSVREFRLGKVTPCFNPTACQKIEEYGRKHGYNFQHALNGGEVRVIGYALDGYDKDKNVVIEYYEKKHMYQSRKDAARKREIVKHLGCRFIELKEWEM